MFSPSFNKSASDMCTVPVSLISATSMTLLFVMTTILKGMVPISKLEWDRIPSRE